ncbi:MAG: ArnT family glycosyltransferase [Chthoniobacterales bacterium]
MTVPALYPWPWKTALCLCAISLLVLGRQLDFSGYAHADEPNKVHQITQDKYNFNHPLLMLHSVKLYARATGISDDYDAVMRAGRWNSVVFSSLAIGFLVLLTGRLHGAWIGAAAGALILCTPLFFELAHYFKEDPALIFGLSLSLLAIQFYGEKPSAVRAAMLGAACGVAVAGKYAGLIVAPFAVYAVFANHRARDLWVVAFSAVAAFALINFPMITSPDLWKSRVDYEVSRLKATGVPNPRKIPHGDYFSDFYKHASPLVFLLLAA